MTNRMAGMAKLKAALVIAMAGALLWSGAAVAAGYPHEIAPGVTVNFPAQPAQMGADGNSFFISVEPSSSNAPTVFMAASITRFGWGQWLARHYPDLLINDCSLGGLESGLRAAMDPGVTPEKMQFEPVQRSAATGGFPGFYATISGIDLGQIKNRGKFALPASSRAQMHGYLLIVNGNLIGMGIFQPEGAHFDRQALDNLVATAHFPPADDVGTPDEQENNFMLVAGAIGIGALVIVIAIIALFIVGIASLVRYRRRKKRLQMAA